MGRRRKEDIYISDPERQSFLKALCFLVKFKRRGLKLSQQALADKCSLAVNTVAEIEQERVEDIRLSTLVSLASGLELSLKDFLLEAVAESKEVDLRQGSELLGLDINNL